MKIGVLTNSLAQAGLRDIDCIADWAVANGFEEIEVGPATTIDEAKFEKVAERSDIKIGAFLYCRNFLLPDDGPAFKAELVKRIELAGKLGIPRVHTSTGIDRGVEWDTKFDFYDGIRKRPIRSMDKVVDFLNEILELAEKNNVKIGLETCPVMGNIAISPYLIEEIFSRVDSDRLGLAYDPSHLVWEMMDPYAPILKFKDKIFHVHGKDTEINRERLNYVGILSDYSWWRYRVPGLGEIDWNKIVANLYEIDFDGCISVEHEDPAWSGSPEKVLRGNLIGKHTIEKALNLDTM